MSIIRYRFPSRLLVLPNTCCFFSDTHIQHESDLFEVIYKFDCGEIATIYITSLGAFGFEFHDSSYLGSIDALAFSGEGLIPDEVVKNEKKIHDLQEARIEFINFVCAVIFGRICGRGYRPLVGATYNGQDRVAEFDFIEGKIRLLKWSYSVIQEIQTKINNYLNIGTRKIEIMLISSHEIDDSISYLAHVLLRKESFEYANMQRCMTINYQAAILHNKQHAAASFILNFSVIESLILEIFMAYGLVNQSSIKSFAVKKHHVSKITKKDFKEKSIQPLVKILYEGELIDYFLFNRIEEARKIRNNLLHKGEAIDPKDSGSCQTTVRDLWTFLIDAPFELVAGWSYFR
ncbi:MAG: hypothetical protein MH252_11515 [Thermosynechococcaceae cyanobacterium MS004]|nr:hypothetical protein [Thermosynechococcaceae cyanobacterium MS004]